MERLKSLPISHIITYIYPNLYPLHYDFNPETGEWPRPVQLSFANIDRNGVYLLDAYDCMYIYICKSVHPNWLTEVFGINQWSKIPDDGELYSESNDPKVSRAPRPSVNSMVNNHEPQHPKTPTSICPLPRLDTVISRKINAFIEYLLSTKPQMPHFFLLR